MFEPTTTLVLAAAGLAALTIAAMALLKGWQGWLELRRMEIGQRGGDARSPAFERIELADMKERLRKLEAIASCVDP